jgi:hypothetical protein
MQIFIARKIFCIRNHFAFAFARNLLLIKAFIEEIYNRFIVYLFLLIWCFMCGTNFELLSSVLQKKICRFLLSALFEFGD